MKVSVRPSKIIGERGLFADINIQKGEYICVLPIDYLQIGEKWYTVHNDNKGPINFRYGIACDLVVPNSDNNISILDTFMNFITSPRIKTRSSIRIGLTGVSNHEIIDEKFIGHMINDYIDMSLLDKQKYNQLSVLHENIEIDSDLEIFDSSKGKILGLRVSAKKYIRKDEELFFSYGVDYWKNYSGIGCFEINPVIYPISLS